MRLENKAFSARLGLAGLRARRARERPLGASLFKEGARSEPAGRRSGLCVPCGAREGPLGPTFPFLGALRVVLGFSGLDVGVAVG